MIRASFYAVTYPPGRDDIVEVSLATDYGIIRYEQTRCDNFTFADVQKAVVEQHGVRVVNDDYADYQLFRAEFSLSCLLGREIEFRNGERN